MLSYSYMVAKNVPNVLGAKAVAKMSDIVSATNKAGVVDGKAEEVAATETDSTMSHCSSNGSIHSALRHYYHVMRGSLAGTCLLRYDNIIAEAARLSYALHELQDAPSSCASWLTATSRHCRIGGATRLLRLLCRDCCARWRAAASLCRAVC